MGYFVEIISSVSTVFLIFWLRKMELTLFVELNLFCIFENRNVKNMKYFKLIIILQIALLGIVGCNPQPAADSLLTQAQKVVDTYPDSAMNLIDSIFYPEKSLSRKRYMSFLVTQVQTKFKTYRPVVEDTLIFKARDYFENSNEDYDQTALAYFYSGCVYREQQHFNEAMQHYKKAEKLASQTDNISLMGLALYNIGDLLAEQRQYGEALKLYNDAAQLYENQPDKQIHCMSATGRMYALLKQPDSAFYYFQKGLNKAESIVDKKLQSLLTQNLSVVYTDIKQYELARNLLSKSYQLNEDSTELPKYYLNFAKIYDSMGVTDSAVYYTDQLKEHIFKTDDNYFKASVYAYLAGWEKDRANYDEAFNYLEARMQTLSRLIEKEDRQTVYDIHRKYDYEQQQKQYYMDLLLRQRWIFILLTAVIAGSVLSTWYWFRQRNKRVEAERKIETLQAMNRNLENTVTRKQSDLRKNMLWRFDIAHKVLDMNNEINMPGSKGFKDSLLIGQFNKIVYGRGDIQKNWEALFDVFKKAQPGLAEKIKENYPELTDTEFSVCILAYAAFSVNETALILNLSPNTIQSRRGSIRRKMGLGYGGDIGAHIESL